MLRGVERNGRVNVPRIKMITGAVMRASARATALRIDPREASLVAVLLSLAAVSWVVTAVRMDGMDMGRWTDPGPLGFFLTTWVVMLAAMMFPSVAPMVIAYGRIHRHRPDRCATPAKRCW